ncbi:TetR/AcrR family transcriptional regulator [Streptomyces sp. SP17BM10]|uniref:TetR/AcrR family transcriptional regulator n=1 Tax=Streptomyces sp. SP17BM10 TaxID=3002530 RepID=UPI002E775CCA|nr:TetR/AcrR family transcriptional regulator [Streptomyces sp. SP17BM10]MEE1782354.1 TetR/AcrR family transcriptional regulator [Streptomyces sp. SP17BM10]
MANSRTPREAWIVEGLRALAGGGPDAVRVEVLAQSMGVTKGGFYGYFRNRDALLAEMLDTWEHAVAGNVIEEIERGGGDARAKLTRLHALASAPGDPLTDISTELAVRDWARREPSVAERLRRVDNRRMAYMRTLYREFCTDEGEVEMRCLISLSTRIGNHFVAADDGPRSREEVVALTRAWLLS